MNFRALLLIALSACGPEVVSIVETPPEVTTATNAELKVPREDRTATVDVGSWNVEWYGDANNGPTNEAKQQANVAQVLSQLDLDLVGLVEVVSESAFLNLMEKLPGHAGLLVTDPRVAGGKDFYSTNEQKVALVYRRRFTVDSARVVLSESAWAFAGRPPMEVKLSFSEGGRPRTLLLVGDLNDDLDRSTYHGLTSPFAALVNDTEHYRFTTDSLTATNTPTTVGFSSTIDHHLATQGLAARYVEGSAKVLRVDAQIGEYGTSTSDHYPVLTRYDLR